MSARPSRFWKTFAIPGVLAVLTATGLFAALLGDGWWDTLAWLAMGTHRSSAFGDCWRGAADQHIDCSPATR
ncbi:hypothetical protein F2S74_26040 [Pseudomonas syringae pv. actinidiae]|nr:hypothetical protein [Pseudomonas syringae pv. actinidiae]